MDISDDEGSIHNIQNDVFTGAIYREMEGSISQPQDDDDSEIDDDDDLDVTKQSTHDFDTYITDDELHSIPSDIVIPLDGVLGLSNGKLNKLKTKAGACTICRKQYRNLATHIKRVHSENPKQQETAIELSDQSAQMEIIGNPEPEHELPDKTCHEGSHLEYNERETGTENKVTSNIEDSALVSGNLFEPMNDFLEVHFGVEFDANVASLHYEDNGKTGILIADDEADDVYILTIAKDGDFNPHEDVVDVSLDASQSTIKNPPITQLPSPSRKHKEGSKQICEKCGKTTTNMSSHKNTHCNTPIDCAVCGKTFSNKGSYYYHIKTHEERQFGCSICGKRYITNTQLRYHMEGHTIKTSYQCPQCSKQFTAMSSLRLHMRIHTGEKPYPCRICGQQFRHMNARIDHERRHTGERPHVCSICGKAFTQRSSLRSHWHMHTTEKNFECEICGKKFARKNGLGQHRKRHAQDRKMFECEVCGLECTAVDGLKKHMKLHQKLNCSGCRRKFDSKEELEKHEKHYEGRKPSSCGVCGQMFHHRMSALRHMNTHTGNRSREFQCDVCEGMFPTERQLKSHKDRFEGQKPYKCGHCGKNFHVQYVAKRHVLYHLKRVIKETTELKSIEKSSLS